MPLRAMGTVPGYLLSQWAMDEHEGHLRVAYTSEVRVRVRVSVKPNPTLTLTLTVTLTLTPRRGPAAAGGGATPPTASMCSVWPTSRAWAASTA